MELLANFGQIGGDGAKKNDLPKEEGREGGEKKCVQRARWARGSNPGLAAC